MSYLEPIHQSGLVYDHIIGIGGIGSGIFFSLGDNRTLGRNESRMATLLPSKDYCKQHIIMHYIAVLMGSGQGGGFQSFPIGRVGKDAIGEELVQKMKVAGMNTTNVHLCRNFPTLYSVCFQYPDHAGGNITTENSASSQVVPEDVVTFFKEFRLSGKQEIVLAAPEVPVDARIKLLEYGRQRGSLNVASLLSSEAEEFRAKKGFEVADLLAINIDEAGSIAQMDTEAHPAEVVINACIDSLSAQNPELSVLITNGGNGSYAYTKNYLEYVPALPVPVSSTAGAGDTFLAGTLTGLCCGLPLTKGRVDEYFGASPLQSAVELGTLLAALSVTSPDTIHPTANAEQLYQFAKEKEIRFGSNFAQVFERVNNKSLTTI